MRASSDGARRGGLRAGAAAAFVVVLVFGSAGAVADVSASSVQAQEPANAEARIAELDAADAETRERAQRWLAVHLATDDLPAVVRALRGDDAEVRRRLTDALAADGRRLGMASVLFADPQPLVRTAGEAALTQMLREWCATCDRRGADRMTVRTALDLTRPAFASDSGRPARPVALVERLRRLGGLAAPIVIDADVHALGAGGYDALVGDGFELLEAVLDAFDLEVEGFGFDDDGKLTATSWLHVTRLGLEGLATGRELLLGAVAQVQTQSSEAPAAARQLAASGWPDALRWLEARWLQGDEDALDALLEAAATGRVAPALATLAGQRTALERADRAYTSGRPGARTLLERTARGLARTGPLGPRGEDLDAPLVAELANELAAPLLWMRLVVLEGRRGASPNAHTRLTQLVARPGLVPALRMQAVRALAATITDDSSQAPLNELADLARWASDAGRAAELVRLAAHLGWAPPAELLGTVSPALALLVADWLHATGDAAGATARFAAAAEALEIDASLRVRAVDALRTWSSREGAKALEERLEPLLEAAGPTAPLARLAARAGVLTDSRRRALAEALLGVPVASRDVELLGHHASGLGGASVRQALLEALERGTELDDTSAARLARGLSAASTTLARAREDEALAIFLREVWRRVDRSSALFQRLAPPRWPPRPVHPRDALDELDRTLDDVLR